MYSKTLTKHEYKIHEVNNYKTMTDSLIDKLFFIIRSLAVFTSGKQIETGNTILSNINIVDVKNAVAIKNQDVIINGNKINKSYKLFIICYHTGKIILLSGLKSSGNT